MSWRAGDTFTHISTPNLYPMPHLYFVISDAIEDSDEVVIVNLTSWRDKADETCILDVRDHPFVTHKSWINYRDAKITTMKDLDKNENHPTIFRDASATNELLRRIQKGAFTSVLTSPRIKEFLRERGLGT